MYHFWAVNGELQQYQRHLFILVDCSKRLTTACSYRTPLGVVPSACFPSQMTTSFHNSSLLVTIPPPPIKRIHPRNVWYDSSIHTVYASCTYFSLCSISPFLSSTITQSTKLDCGLSWPNDHSLNCFCLKCFPRSHIAQPWRKITRTWNSRPRGRFIHFNYCFQRFKN